MRLCLVPFIKEPEHIMNKLLPLCLGLTGLFLVSCKTQPDSQFPSTKPEQKDIIAYQVFMKISPRGKDLVHWELRSYIAYKGMKKMNPLPVKQLLVAQKTGYYGLDEAAKKNRYYIRIASFFGKKEIYTPSSEGVTLSFKDTSELPNSIYCAMLYHQSDLSIGVIPFVGNIEYDKTQEIYSYFSEEGRTLLQKSAQDDREKAIESKPVPHASYVILKDSELIPFRKGNQWGFCDKNKNIVVSCKYPMIIMVSPSISYLIDSSAFGIISPAGEIIYPVEKCYAWGITCSSMLKLTVKNRNGEQIVLSHEWAKKYLKNMNQENNMTETGHIGFANTSEENCQLKAFTDSGKWGMKDVHGEIIIPAQYTMIGKQACGMIPVQDGYKWGYFDSRGKILIPFKYSIACPFINGLALVRDLASGKWGYIDKQGIQYWE